MNASARIDEKIASYADWRGPVMADVRRVIREAVPDVTEEWKWMGTPTFSRDGILCVLNAFKGVVKVTFLNGALLPDPDGVFNADLEGNRYRAVRLVEGEKLKVGGFKKVLRAAVALNAGKKAAKKGRPSVAKAGGSVKPAVAKVASAAKAPGRSASSATKARAGRSRAS